MLRGLYISSSLKMISSGFISRCVGAKTGESLTEAISLIELSTEKLWNLLFSYLIGDGPEIPIF